MIARSSLIIASLLLLETTFAQAASENRPGVPFAFGADQKPLVIQLAKGWNALFANVRINERDAGYFLIDTRSSWTSVDRDHAKQLGLDIQARPEAEPLRGQKVAGLVMARTLAFGPVIIGNTPIWITEAPYVFHGVKIGGVLGMDVLGQGPVTIDFRTGVLTLYDPARFEAPRSATPYELQLGSDTPLVRASMQGNFGQKNSGWFELDSTDFNDMSLCHSWLVMDRNSGHGGVRISGGGLLGADLGQSGRAGAEANHLYVSFFQSLEVCGGISSPAQRIYGQQAEGLETSAGAVGLETLQKMTLTFDLWQHRAWVKWYENKEPVEAMLQRLGDPKQADVVGATPLLIAALGRRGDVVQKLLEQHVDANAADALGITALMAAAGRGDGVSIEALLKAGAQIDARSQTDGFTALLCAAQSGDVNSLTLLLKASGSAIEGTSKSGRTPLYLTAEARSRLAMQLLLDRGAEVDHALPDHQTPLMAACANDNADCVKILVEHHANVEASGQRGTPMTLACEVGSAACVRLLLQYGARADQMDELGRTPLAAAAGCYGGAECVKVLLDAGAKKDQTCRDGKLPYDWAVRSGSAQTLRMLAN